MSTANTAILQQTPAIHAGLDVLIQAVLLPALLRRPDLKSAFTHLRAASSARQLGLDPSSSYADSVATQEAMSQHLQRVSRTRNKARELLRPLMTPQIEADLAEWIRFNTGHNVPMPSLSMAAQEGGWLVLSTALGKHLRSLQEQGIISTGPRRTWRMAEPAPDLSAMATKQVHLSRCLGSLTRTVLQRFQKVEGSVLWALQVVGEPEALTKTVIGTFEGFAERLETAAVQPMEIPEERMQDYVLVAPSVLCGPQAFEPAAGRERGWSSDLLLATVGGDVGLRLGSVKAAEEVLQRTVIDALFDIAEGMGESPITYIAERYGLRSPNTIQSWRTGRRLGHRGPSSIANTAQLNALRVRLGNLLIGAWPQAMNVNRLLARLRKEEPHSELPDPAVVELALGLLASEGVLEITTERGERRYAFQRNILVASKEEIETMRGLMGQDLTALASMVSAVEHNHPAAEVRGGLWCLPRASLAQAETWLNDTLSQELERNVIKPPGPEGLGDSDNSVCKARLIIQMRVAPIVHPIRR